MKQSFLRRSGFDQLALFLLVWIGGIIVVRALRPYVIGLVGSQPVPFPFSRNTEWIVGNLCVVFAVTAAYIVHWVRNAAKTPDFLGLVVTVFVVIGFAVIVLLFAPLVITIK